MPLFLLDRDGVVVVNRKDNIKTPAGLNLIAGAAEAIARLSGAGFDVAICTNQPEVARGAMSRDRARRSARGPDPACWPQKARRIGRILVLHLRAQDAAHEAGGRHAAGGAGDVSAPRAADTPFVGDRSRRPQGGLPRRLPARPGAHRAGAQGSGRRAAGLRRAGRRLR